VCSSDLTCHGRTGEIIPVSMSLFAILDPGTDRPVCLAFVMRDMRQHRKLEDQLRQSQKMEAVGQLAAGIAHDFNNILTVIVGNSGLLKLEDNLTPEAHETITAIEQVSLRAANLVRQLLTFSRRQTFSPKPLDLNEVVHQTLRMLRRTLYEHIEIQVISLVERAPVLADAGMIEQMVTNLAVNARDAMPKGGQLLVRILAQEVTDGACGKPAALPAGRHVCLEMRDTGCGMTPEVMKHIFEPFFTTKDVGKGSGLGLASVYGIVDRHEGWITVESEPDAGTTFRIYFPWHAANAAAPERQSATSDSARGP